MTGQEEYPRFISNRPCGNDKYEGKSQELRIVTIHYRHIQTFHIMQSRRRINRKG